MKELTEEMLNKFPIESFDFTRNGIYLKLKIKNSEDGEKIEKQFIGMNIVNQKEQ